ncbi:MAG: PQQ-binding-like beta-propeller repeat protein [Verrucomicrobiota bacterium]
MRLNQFLRVTMSIALLAGGLVLNAATPDWSAKLPENVKWQTVTGAGTILVGTEKAIYSLDPETGAIMWKRTEFEKSAPFNVREIEGTPILFINDYSSNFNPKTKLYAVNLLSGETLWETPQEQGYPLGAYPFNAQGIAVVVSQGYTDKEGAGVFLTAYETATGKQVWRVKHSKQGAFPLHPADNSGTFNVKMDLSGHQEPVIVGDLLYVPFSGVHCYDVKTGALKWEKEFKTVPKEFKRASAPLVFDGETVYAPGVNKVYALDKNTGALKWESKKVYSGTITQLLVTGDKLLVRMGGNFLAWGAKEWTLEKPLAVLGLDKNSGEQVWEYKDLKDGITNMQLVEGANAVFVCDAQNLIGIDVNSTGKVKEAFKVKLEFKRKLGGGEAAAKIGLGALGGISGLVGASAKAIGGKDRLDVPVAIIPVGKDQFVVRGRQHILSFDGVSKDIKWSTQYPAPGSSGFEMAIMTTLTAFSAVTYNAGYASGTMSLNSASDGIKSSLDSYDKFANKRYSATKDGTKRTYILTTVEEGKKKGAGLMAIDMTSGDSAASVLLKDKEPEYSVDDVTGRLYYVNDKKEIQAFSVK